MESCGGKEKWIEKSGVQHVCINITVKQTQRKMTVLLAIDDSRNQDSNMSIQIFTTCRLLKLRIKTDLKKFHL